MNKFFRYVFGRLYTEACAPKGDGICDGYVPESSMECECNCHVAPNLPSTQLGVKVWHDELWQGISGK